MSTNFDFLKLESWDYADFFIPQTLTEVHPVVQEVEAYIESVHLEEHAFFQTAMSSKKAIELWVSQELVMTNAFSQIVLQASSYIPNVHIRAILSEVAFGEHHTSRHGCAKRSHPWLLHQLRESIGIAQTDVKPTAAAKTFLQKLAATASNPISAIAAIGVGNERLIIPEYNAIKKCFYAVWPAALHEPFLNANIDEDIGHSKLCYLAATALINQGMSAQTYLDAAKASVDNRIAYFDDLSRLCGLYLRSEAA